ncbi:MAG: DUF1801 domain-containing protein [Bacteroidota bacterium]
MLAHVKVSTYLHQLEENCIRTRFAEIRALLLTFPEISETFRYRTPFYDYNGMLLYLSLHKKKFPLIGFVDGYHMKDEAGLLVAKEGQTMIKHLYIKSENEPSEEVIVGYIADAIETRNRLKKYALRNKTVKRK